MTAPQASADRFKNRQVPPPVPAYLPTAGSPLAVNKELYQGIQRAPRRLIKEFTLPIRSGRAWDVPAGAIVKISTPEGAQVGSYTNLLSRPHVLPPSHLYSAQYTSEEGP